QDADEHDFSLTYLNRDGSLGELCGNASLCATRLAVELGIADPAGLTFSTDAGSIHGRLRDGQPEVDLQPPEGLRPDAGISKLHGELRMGFVTVGVPHLVVRTSEIDLVELSSRGPELRYHESLKAGANVNWVSPDPDGGWRIRTYERGVEAETLACGTGSVACAVVLGVWGEAGGVTKLKTRSGRTLTVTLRPGPSGEQPSLSGEGRIVFEGLLREL
ncbi:MAG: diaminopimelate epimerase, partial [Anaerolinea sp.]|nr:diaminopimelate epimerase [Anaerolinea sp.]